MRLAHVLLIGLMALAATVDGQSQAGSGAKSRASQKQGTASPPSSAGGRGGAPSANGKGRPPVPPPRRSPPSKMKKGLFDLFNGKGNPKQTPPATPMPPPGSKGGDSGRPAQSSAEARAQFDPEKKELARSRDLVQQQAATAAAPAGAKGSRKPASSDNSPKTAFGQSGARGSPPVRRAPTPVPRKAGGKPGGSGAMPSAATTKSAAAGKQSWGSKLAEGRTKKATDGQSQRWKTRGARDSKPKGAPQHPLKEPIPAKEKGEKFFSNLRKKLAQQAKMFSNVRRQKDSGL